MISMYKFSQIRRLIEHGHNNSQIAKELMINRRTVAKYRDTNSPPGYSLRRKKTRIDPFLGFEETVSSWLKITPTLSGYEIFDLLKEKGYEGSLRTVQSRVRDLREASQTKERFFQQEYEPGEQAQVDFKESVQLPFLDGPRTINLHFMTLPFSGTFYITGYPNKAFESFMDGIHRFYQHIGGVPRGLRFDNLAACVSKVLRGNARKYTDSFSRAADYYGFKLLPCRPGKGSDKGDVERDIRTHARRILNLISHHGVVFKDSYDLNQWLHEYCQKRQPNGSSQKLALEKEKLLPNAVFDESIVYKSEDIRVSSFGLVKTSKRTSYSVPDAYIDKFVTVVTGPYEVKIYSKKNHKRTLICAHGRVMDNESSVLLEHILPSLVRKPGAMLRWSHKDLLFPDSRFSRFYAFLKATHPDSCERDYVRSINLIQYVSLDEVGAGMDLVREIDSKDPFFELKNLVVSDGHRPQHFSDEHQQKLRPNLTRYDDLVPNLNEEKVS